MGTSPLLLLLLDSRAPAGGHAHSGGMEPAVTAGFITNLDDVEDYCRGRLRTSGRVAAEFAATACAAWLSGSSDAPFWELQDVELDARLPSEALRSASRSLGNGLRRMVRSMFPDADLPWTSGPPHHPLVLGVAVALAGGDPAQAAHAALLTSITAPASAAVRLLGLDPLAVQGMLSRLTAEISWSSGGELPADSAPFTDLLADVHRTSEVRLFAS